MLIIQEQKMDEAAASDAHRYCFSGKKLYSTELIA
jgi:hypothetical protein